MITESEQFCERIRQIEGVEQAEFCPNIVGGEKVMSFICRIKGKRYGESIPDRMTGGARAQAMDSLLTRIEYMTKQ